MKKDLEIVGLMIKSSKPLMKVAEVNRPLVCDEIGRLICLFINLTPGKSQDDHISGQCNLMSK